jgi:kinesin family protein 2/24
MIDLAGSESARDVAVHGPDRMRETRQINISLSVLKDCIRGNAQAATAPSSNAANPGRKSPHIPFRQSALTRVLKHVFDPASTRACRTVVIACVNPSLADVSPSKNTLRFAELLRVLVPVAPERDAGGQGAMSWTNAQLKTWIDANVRIGLICRNYLPFSSRKLTEICYSLARRRSEAVWLRRANQGRSFSTSRAWRSSIAARNVQV